MRDNNINNKQTQDTLIKEIMKEYWIKVLSGDPVKTTLPMLDRSKAKGVEEERSALEFLIPDDLYNRVMILCNHSPMGFFVFLTAALNALLYKYSRNGNIIIGTAGFTINKGNEVDPDNILILKNRVSGDLSFKELLAGVKDVVLGAYKNRAYPFAKIKKWLKANKKLDVREFLNIAFVSEQVQAQPDCLQEFDLVIRYFQKDQRNWLCWEYNRDIYHEVIIHQSGCHFINFLTHVLENLEGNIEEVDILGEGDKQTLLHFFNETGMKNDGVEGRYDGYKTKTIHELFEARAARTPGHTAVVCVEQLQITYAELNKRANQLARQLRKKGVKPGTIVALMLEPSVGMVTGMLAVLKSGGVYLPVDPDYPSNRKQYMVRDSSTILMLVHRHLLEEEQNNGVLREFTAREGNRVIIIDEDFLYTGESNNPGMINTPADPAYINYTSGTTGNPRGVVVSHGNVTAYLDSFFNEFDMGPGDTVLQQAPYSFDVIVEELYPVLLRGGRLAIPGEAEMTDIDLLVEFMVDRDVTFITCSPIMLSELNKRLPQYKNRLRIHTFISGGDVLRESYIDNLLEIGSVYNTYGPTETTVCATYYRCDAGKGIPASIPIGKPILNSRVYIVDAGGGLVPIGVAGELCISGEGVSPGYLNRPLLTAERFVFVSYKSYRTYRTYISKKIYKTGDLGRWLPDGNIQFLGRVDFQVKIRGYRVELEEVECQLCTHPLVSEAVVLAGENDGGDKYLCAYIVTAGGLKDKERDLRDYLSRILPDYMLPSSIVQLHHGDIPRTPTGKVDRKSLLEMEGRRGKTTYIAPTDEIEEKLTEIWADLLNLESGVIGINGNFFELGGHSLKATVMISRIHKRFDVTMQLIEIFREPTVKGLAEYIRKASKYKYDSIKGVEKKQYYVLSSAQKRIYILQQMDPGSSGYNMPLLEVLEGDIDKEKLEKGFREIIARHESLRTSFHLVEEVPVQRVHDPDEMEFAIEYFSVEPGAESPLSADIIRGFIHPFDLANAPLLRVRLIKQEEKRYVLMVDMHHIISDGQSLNLIAGDFKARHEGKELPLLRLQYRDYAEWQNRGEQAAALENQEKYWLKEFRGEIPVLNLPTDFARPAVQGFEGHQIHFELGERETMSLHNLARAHDLTLYMVLLTIYYVLLSKLSGQRDIVVGTPVLGRRHADLENIIGMFVNTLPLKNDAVPGKRFKDFLKEVGERALSAYENQEYPFEELVEKLAVERDTGRNPLFDTMFALADGTREQSNRKDYQYNDFVETSKFDLTLMGSDRGGTLSFVFEYSTNLFKQEKIERFAAYFKTIVSSVLENEAQQLAGIEMLSREEKRQLLVDFSNAGAEYLKFKPINDFLEGQVSRTPGKVAVVTASCLQVTYGELNERAGELADIIRTAAGKNNCIGLMFDDNPYLLTAIFAVIKSGNWFVPIAPNYPDDRIHFVVNDCGIKLLLTDKANQKKAGAIVDRVPYRKDLTCVCIDTGVYGGGDRYKDENENRIYREGYIIYTSGSTGRPKGVLITQENLVPLLVWFRDYFRLGEDTRVLQSLSYSFDFGIFEILTTVLFGGALYQGRREELLNPADYAGFIEVHDINTIHTTPSFFSNVVSSGIKMPGLKIVHLGGEVLTVNMVIEMSKLVSPDCMIYNGYGPTEASVNSSIFGLRAGDAVGPASEGMQVIPIGKPSANNIIYILDKFNNPRPVEVAGELCVSGRGVSMGYLNRPELTAEKFLHLTLNTQHLTLYKTGDLARWHAGGNIEFLGRLDQQVKIRGFRIELEEIENRLLETAVVKKAVVIDREINGEKYLCAYIVLAEGPGSEPTAVYEELRKHLSGGLPGYMVPSYFMVLEGLPLTPTGKTDRNVLPEPEAVAGSGYVSPGNEIEGQLVEIWSEVLGVIRRPIGIYDNFFELGGHSLKATVLAAKIHNVFDIKVPLIEIFKVPTIKGLSEYISNGTKERYLPIEPAEEKEYYVLSPAQRRLYYLQQLEPGSTVYNIPYMEVLDWEAGINRERLEQAFKKLILRHEPLRTFFYLVEGNPVQGVCETVDFAVEYYEAGMIRGFVRPFDLAGAPLMRAGLIKTQEHKYILVVDMHHITADGISSLVLVKDFIGLYNGEELPVLRLQYKDYARWQKVEKEKGSLERRGDYWLKRFAGDIPVLNLPLDYPRPEIQQFAGDAVDFELGREETAALQRLAFKEGVTLYMVLLSLYTILLSRITGQEDIVVGTPVSGRRHADLEGIIGMFVNTLALRSYPCGEKSFITFLGEIKESTVGGFENQDYPFEELVEILPVERESSRNPIFDVMLNWWSPAGIVSGTAVPTPFREGQAKVSGGAGIYNLEHKTAKFDMILTGREENETIVFALEYCTKLFKRETIERFIGYFKRIAGCVVHDPPGKISGIHIISEEEKDKILYGFNKTAAEYPGDKAIHQLFEEQAARTPDGVALVGPSPDVMYITRGVLNREADRLAFRLKEKGIGRDTVVGVMIERSLKMVVGIFAVLKSGGAYLPIDPGYPPERIHYMLEDSNAALLLTGDECPHPGRVTVCRAPANRPATSLAYIIYTSGSTGKPKGVMVEHRSAINRLYWMQRVYPLGEGDRILQKTPTIFDLSVWELFGWTFQGASLCLLGPGEEKSPESIVSAVAYGRITMLHFVPSMLNAFLYYVENSGDVKALRSIRQVFCGGETLGLQQVKRFKRLLYAANNTRLSNLYGPTEAAVDVSFFDCELAGEALPASIPIGRPIDNIRLIIFDRYSKIQPVGISGELGITGDGVARGYLNRPELTAEKFLHLTLNTQHVTLYKTGDLARWLADGNIEFLGRIDHQVKVRGFRIELGEIEAKLLAHEKIKEAVVAARSNDGTNAYLCAYIVLDALETGAAMEKEALNIAGLREYLAGELPEYMVPSYFVQLGQLPLTPGGKTDRKALPEPETGVVGSGTGYAAPGNFAEEKLLDIWAKILRIEKKLIGVNTSFFELGGHSLLAISMIAVIHKKLAVKIPLRQVLKDPTVRHLARYIKEAGREQRVSIAAVEEKEYYNLSYAQRRLWVLCQFEKESTAYNVPGAVIVSGRLDIDAFRSAVRALVERHESMRTVFPLVDGEPKQRIIGNFQINVETVDLRVCEESGRGERARAVFREYANRVFDLEHGPLLLITLVRLQDENYLLISNIHHIIIDGWSRGIIESEFICLYNHFLRGEKNPFPPLSLQYKDYTLWHNGLLRGDGSGAIEAYWLEKFKDRPNGIELPLDHPRRPVQTFNGRRVHFSIDGETMLSLRRWCSGQPGGAADNATLFMGLLTLVDILLYKYSSQRDIIIGSPIAGRHQDELRPLVGFLVNTLVYRTEVNPGESFKSLLNRVREETLACYENQDYPFDMLVERLELDRDLSQSPLFNVMLAHNNRDTRGLDPAMADVEISPYPHAHDVNMSKFDLLLFMEEMGDQIYVYLEYNSDLFEAGTIERMADNFLTLTRSVIHNPEQPIGGLAYIDPREYRTILQGFNDNEEQFPSLTVQELFEQQAAKTPDHIAAAAGREHIGYRELNRESNRLGHYLREEFSLAPGDIIGISMDRCLEMIIALLGIIKSGAVYMALDPAYPAGRISYMLADSNTKLVLVDQPRPGLFSGYKGNVVDIKADWPGIALKSPGNPEAVNRLADVLYVTYTSGSTGVPNGAMVSHHILTNLIQWQKEKTTIDGSLRCLQFTSINFDVSFQEIMSTLTAGGELVLIGEQERKDVDYLMEFLCTHGIEVLYLPFYYLNFLFSEGRWAESVGHCLRHIVTAGEQLIMTPGLKRFLESNPGVRLHNHYGPAEMHVVTAYTLAAPTAGDRDLPPIGKPIANVGIYILDEQDQPVPVGVWGEICIGGSPGFAGYVNKPGLTAGKLLMCPVVSGPRQGLYRTGDIGRRLADGNIELKGRKDSQVKIRGFRVEPGEIESKILAVDNIRECVVVVREDTSHQKYLAAYLVVNDKIEVGEIRRLLSRDMPQYMIPRLTVLESLPLMPNGKVDRKKLPEPEFHVEQEFTAPRNELETRLWEIWSELLGIEAGHISIHSNFFELGGHSLKATAMVSRIHNVFDVRVPLMEVFKQPTIRELARYIKGAEIKERFASIEPVEKRDYYVLSPAQKRMYILQQMDLESTAYNMPGLTVFQMNIEKEKLENTFRKLIDRHGSLRTSFHMVENRAVQRINEKVEFEVQYFDLAAEAPGVTGKRGEIQNSFIRPFDLSNAPLLRVMLIKEEEKRYILIVDLHHIICDGISTDLIVNDFMALYNGSEPPPLRFQYRDYAEWQNREPQKESLKKQETYWLEVFNEGIPVLYLPYDYARPAVQLFAGDAVEFEIGERDVKSLGEIAGSQGITLYMVLLAAFNVMLAKLGGQEDIVVGTPVAGRRHADLENIIGMFVNTLALRNYPSGQKSFVTFLEELKESTLGAFENQDHPFEELVEKLSVQRDTGRNPIFDVMFSWHALTGTNKNRDTDTDTDKHVHPQPSEQTGIYGLEHKISKFDMTLTGAEKKESVAFTFAYCAKLFKRGTIERFTGYFKKIITSILEDRYRTIAEIDILSEEEKRQLLVDFSNAGAEYLKFKPINDFLEGQVSRTPGKVAVTAESCLQVTYRELNERANGLADIIGAAAGKNNCIGLMFDDNPYLLTAIFAVIKSGNWFVPIAPGYPDDRIHFVVNDCGIKLLLTDKANQKKAGAIVDRVPYQKDLTCVCIETGIESNHAGVYGGDDRYKDENENRIYREGYIIYTSGSTGRPKGVLITQENLVPLLVWFRDYFRLGEDTRVLQSLSYSFDFGVFEILTTVLFGGALYQGRREELLNLTDYAGFIGVHDINTIHTTPSFFSNVVSSGIKMPGLKIVHLGGEVLTVNMVIEMSKLLSPDCMIYNGYGPTEASVNSSIFGLRAGDAVGSASEGIQAIPIGKPSANNIIYILDKFNNLQPVEVAGELCVSGRGVSMGYLNRPELTTEKFLHLTLNTQHLTLYKTGDLARWHAGGNIEFLGRLDQQVKIRGFRIELEEIENRLLETAVVKKAVVIDREINGEKYLCAYIVLADGAGREAGAPIEELRNYLSLRLPGYMIPSYFMVLEELPLSPTGKTDLKALPEPEAVVGTEYAPPGNEIEEQLVEIWAEILGKVDRPIGIDDNFFELGGHSLNATSMLSRIHRAFDIKIPLMTIFKTPTIRSLSGYIKAMIKNSNHREEAGEMLILEKSAFEVEFNI